MAIFLFRGADAMLFAVAAAAGAFLDVAHGWRAKLKLRCCLGGEGGKEIQST